MHDGSYMKDVATDICSFALIIRCARTQRQCTCMWVEKCQLADNYRGEALGALTGILLLRAASGIDRTYRQCGGHCDNKGVVIYCNKPRESCPDKQVQADVFMVIKKLLRELPFNVSYHHVMGHLDKILRWDQLSEIQKLNVLCDSMAKKALIHAIRMRIFIDRGFPFEDITLECGGEKVSGSPTQEIR